VSWWRSHRRNAWICGVTLLLPVLLYVDVLAGLWGQRSAYQARVDELVPRLARLHGLIEHRDALQEAAEKVDRQVLDLVYPASRDQASVAASVQTEVRDIFTGAGLSVSNSQVLPVKEEDNFDHIGLRLQASGGLAALDEALAGLSAHLPLVLVESIELTPSRAGRAASDDGEQVLNVGLQLLALRAAR